MTKAKHTPGPWVIKDHDPCSAYSGGRHIMSSGGYSDPMPHTRAENEANARLIAAAPDLLEALESAVTALEWAKLHLSEAGIESGQVSGTIPEARAAIAKAKGEA